MKLNPAALQISPCNLCYKIKKITKALFTFQQFKKPKNKIIFNPPFNPTKLPILIFFCQLNSLEPFVSQIKEELPLMASEDIKQMIFLNPAIVSSDSSQLSQDLKLMRNELELTDQEIHKLMVGCPTIFN